MKEECAIDMDEYYVACREKLRDSNDPIGAIGELVSLALNDLPKIQICKLAEQSVSLLSAIYQITSCPTPELMTQFQQVRGYLNFTLDYMEQTINAQIEFPSLPPPPGDDYWL